MAKLRINTRDGLAKDVEIHQVDTATLTGTPELQFSVCVLPGKRLNMHWEDTELPEAEVVITSDLDRPVDIKMTHFDVDFHDTQEDS